MAPRFTFGVYLTVRENTGFSASKLKYYTFSNDINKTYCGPCQFHDREQCKKLNGICWNNYLTVNEASRVNSNYCLFLLSIICNEIWSNKGLSDSQCIQYINVLNYTEMNQIPKVVSAKYINGLGLNIIVTFDININYANIHSCNSVLKNDTLLMLGPSNCSFCLKRILFRFFHIYFILRLGI